MGGTRPILFATDGSPSAGEAQHMAFELAKSLAAPLVVVSVHHLALPAAGYVGYGYTDVIVELGKQEHQRVSELLASMAEAAEAEGLQCLTVAADGPTVEVISEQAREHDAKLIVVGSHGWGAAKRFFSGSVSTGLVHSAPCPVLVVRPPTEEQEGEAIV